MRFVELLRLVWINILQNKFKVLLTSVGIIVGAATIVMVIAVGKGGQADVAEQFKNLNAGAIDVSFSTDNGKSSTPEIGGGNIPEKGSPSNSNSKSNAMPGNIPSSGGGKTRGEGNSNNSNNRMDMFGGGPNSTDRMLNKEKITLTAEDVEDITDFIPDIDEVTISFSTKSTVTGGELEEETSYTVAGVKENYADMSNLTLSIGDFITDSNDDNKEKVCILGYDLAVEIFGSAMDAYDCTIYINQKPYIVNGVLDQMGVVSSGISPDTSIFIPYNTGIKYLTGKEVSPTITVIASNVDNVETVKTNIETILAETYPNSTFTLTDAGSKMEAALESSNTLTLMLIVVAGIVFIVGGIGIMNVLFVSVKERTKEIGILKAIGCSQRDILIEFLTEAGMISIFGGISGVLLSLIILLIAPKIGIRVIPSGQGFLLAIVFAFITGTVFGFYPAWKASKLVPVEALSEE
ncbi:ABC transporter permease [Anaerosacchariphilus polymeriproducens]|uniref:Macrolide ABC transporter ATP-binding protein n=1 Tax=Anaerosacchariphilus polymeriproducens TaxID=1812858 RepID=A0A371AXX0_9FIRM|nr:ABC transporter permease [Anaerosacchariphilus polymeriproducens]RDU24399.1 macrolide ABC transporter ATP-binding protein [Anaerosacchariphilus polymeriproducens]